MSLPKLSLIVASVAVALNLVAIWLFDQAELGLLFRMLGLMLVFGLCLRDYFRRDASAGERGDVLLIALFVLMSAFLIRLAQFSITITFDDYYTRFSVGQITDVVLYLFVFLLAWRIISTFDAATKHKYSWLIYITFCLVLAVRVYLAALALYDMKASIVFYFLLATMSLAAVGSIRLLTFAKNFKQALLPLAIFAMIILQFWAMSLLGSNAPNWLYTTECLRGLVLMLLYPICTLSRSAHLE